MNIPYFILYYSIFLASIVFYTSFRKKNVISTLDIIFYISLFSISISGYTNSFGYAIGYKKLNIDIFYDYVLYMTILPLAFIFGSRFTQKYLKFTWLDNEIIKHRFYALYIFVFIFSLTYFYFIRDNIPLLKVLTGGVSDYGELTLNRLKITHDFEANYKIPFFLRYYQLVISDLMKLLLSISSVLFFKNRRKYAKLFLITLLFSLFTHLYSLEKSGAVYIILILILNYFMVNLGKVKLNFINIGKALFLLIISILTMYILFMGVANFKQAAINMFNRTIVGQTGMVYLQDIILKTRYGGNLGGRGIPIFILDSIFNRKIINLSREVYEIVFSNYTNRGGVGTTGGMPMFFLRSNFGLLIGSIILWTISFITAIIDKSLLRKIILSQNTIPIALYSVFMILALQSFLGNFTKLYMLPLLLSPSVIVIVIAILFLNYKRS